jgi:hypothetical protein
MHGRVAGTKHGAIAVVRMFAAVERVNRLVAGNGEEAVVPFVADQPVGASAAPEPVRPAASVEQGVFGATPKPVGTGVAVQRVVPP